MTSSPRPVLRRLTSRHTLTVALVLSLLLAGSICHWRHADPTAPSEMVLVPAGNFWMGLRDDAPADRPRRLVFVSSFYIDRTEVTIAQYARFVRETGYKPPFVDEPWAAPYNWVDGAPPAGYGNHPVTLVNWYDAAAYCAWAGKRLPTEAEWEKAARGPQGLRYPWGDTWDPSACNHGKGGPDNYDSSDGYETTSPVGAFPTGMSPYGLLDMFGNAWEWTADWYSLGWQEEVGEVRDGVLVDPTGPSTGFDKVVRGGSFFFDLENDLRAERAFMFPGSRRKSTGFRCARSAAAEVSTSTRQPGNRPPPAPGHGPARSRSRPPERPASNSG